MQPSRDVSRLVEIMAALRDPQSGCPWDIEQSFETIVPYTIEEAYEVADAVERRDADELCEELGDLLLQVVYHAQLATELGLFDFGAVVEAVTRKMIRRHPHVFGDAEARSARSAKGQWDRIKAEERAEKATRRAERRAGGVPADGWSRLPSEGATARLLDAVPTAFPALTEALKVQQRAATVGFDWDAAAPIIDKIREEIGEFADAVRSADADAREDEFGDMLFSLVNLARYHEIDPEAALRRTSRKFRRRFGHVEARLEENGRTAAEADLTEMEALWQEAKSGLGGNA
ncbi:nucleoside triphosphate pyrophosphohydrolase [Mangrovibrevibacter kandeliae]|uniref:nucleoside triphosphate pyrophosphohydrolase n=1 Tax=Mangrovibrevibacter kandeliae TaxID=2968473 RepID=UPI002118B6AC|nr:MULTISPECIES: nucleoside triphosphate pyrophosphohydrolase [unclassified Aurantimonas]MCQ8782615.1 nucleoside triphosphate pyrophosphohydrolase [Aurantimonas sp. CSK15Z-1]MCW4114576.1 nucleoside triphosphate pyrophosphohydrolase [Aurantimonas sp. MSK8Z-1]